MKNFTVVTLAHNVDLTKDVGLIAYGMKKYYGMKAIIATYCNEEFSNLDRCIPGVEIKPVRKITGIYDIDSLLYVFVNARDIDVLNCYNLRLVSAAKIWIYKRRNKKGKTYLKLDGGGYYKEDMTFIRKCVYGWVMKNANLVSAEIETRAKKLSKNWEADVSWIRNPFHPSENGKFIPFNDRENIILTVGRLGTEPKASEILIDAFRLAKSNIPNWKLYMIGPLEDWFKEYTEEWFNRYPEMRDSIIFTGNITDRSIVSEYYKRAKIFVLPSRHEGFSLTLTEAGSNGDFIIGTKIPCIQAFTRDFTLGDGVEIDDIEGLAKKIMYWVNHEKIMEKKAHETYVQTRDNYSLKRVCESIYEGLQHKD